jgi:dTDP-4-dehydrorhamnose reductase
VLVLGATGMLGSDLVKVLTSRNHAVTAFSSKDLDLTNHRAVQECPALSKKKHDWVINCAAYTAVDKAEEEPELAWDINEEGALNLAERLENGPRLLHLSTDFVFDGTKGEPYVETDEPNPLGTYGQTKLGGERYIEALTQDAVIFRTSWLYGANGKSFPKTIIKAHEAGKAMRVVNDQIGCPTYTVDLATACTEAVETGLTTGIYHAVGNEPMSWYQFAEKTLAVWKGKKISIEGIPTSEYPTLAKRPAYSVLDTRKLTGAAISPWRDTTICLQEFCSRLKNDPM